MFNSLDDLTPRALFRKNRPRFQSGELILGQLPAFGTSTAQELSTVDPRDRQSIRLEDIRAKQARFPGRRPGGSGLTGLTSSDAQGWSDMLNEQTEAIQLENALKGQPPAIAKAGFRYIGRRGKIDPGGESDLQGGSMGDSREGGIAGTPDWWLQGEPDPREVTAQNLPRIRKNLDMMPPSLRSLYAERFRQK